MIRVGAQANVTALHVTVDLDAVAGLSLGAEIQPLRLAEPHAGRDVDDEFVTAVGSDGDQTVPVVGHRVHIDRLDGPTNHAAVRDNPVDLNGDGSFAAREEQKKEKGTHAVEKLMERHNETTPRRRIVCPTARPRVPMLDVRDLSYTYPGTSAPAIRGLTFHIAPGEVFGFLGPSGSGKSTTQKVLIGLQRGYSGAVTILGHNLADWGADYYERVGVSFELPNHYLKLTARENLAYFAALYAGTTEPIDTLLEAVGLDAAADQRVGAFSKGMKLRLNLARALLHRPALLFLDEPTAGLDPVTARRIKDLIRAQQQAGTTIFLTTHDMVVADDLCNRVAFIVDGAIRLIEEPRVLKRQYGRRAVRIETGAEDAPRIHDFPLDGLADNAAFLAALRDGPIQTLHTLETTLDDVFVQVTGRRLQ